jgi:hypothetical protein
MGEIQIVRVENVGDVSMLCPSVAFYSPIGWPLSTPIAPFVGQGYIVCRSIRQVDRIRLQVSKVFSVCYVASLQHYWWCCMALCTSRAMRVIGTVTNWSLSSRVVGKWLPFNNSTFNTPQHPTANVSPHWCLSPAPSWLRRGWKHTILDTGSRVMWLSELAREGISRNYRVEADLVRPSCARLSHPWVGRTESVSDGTQGTTPHHMHLGGV